MENQESTSTAEVNAGHLKSFIERIESLDGQRLNLVDDIKDVYAEAKANGFDVKILKKVIAVRKMDRDARIEEETILELYLSALGIN